MRVPPYIRVGAGGAGGAALQTEKVGVEAMARPLILGLLSLLGLLAAGKRCPPPSELLPHQLSPGGLEERFSERPACSGRGQRGGGKADPNAVCIPPAGPAPRSQTEEAGMREGGGNGAFKGAFGMAVMERLCLGGGPGRPKIAPGKRREKRGFPVRIRPVPLLVGK